MKKTIGMIVAGLSMLVLVIMPSMVAAQEQVIPGSVERDLVIRVARGIYAATNIYMLTRTPNLEDRIETYYEKGDAAAVIEMTGVLLDLMFMYTHPRIKLEYIAFDPPFEKYEETLMAAIAAGTAPSIIAASDIYTNAKEGILADITDYVTEWKRFEKIPEAAWDQCRVGDRYYAFPGVFEYNSGLMYRRDWFKEAGIFNAAGEAAPPDNWTMEDFLDISMKIAGSKKDRYACNVGPETRIQPGDISAFGDFGVKPDPTGKYTWRVDFDTPGKRYFEWLARLVKSGSVLYGTDIGGSEDTWDFYGGRTGMRLAGWPVMYLAGDTYTTGHGHGLYPPEVDVIRDIGGLKYPAGPEGIVPNSLSYSLFGVVGTQTEEEIAASMEWIRWCLDEDPNPVMEQQALSWWLTTLGDVPTPVRFFYNVIERPPVDVYDHVVDVPGQPKDWTEIPEIEPLTKLNAEIRALPFKPLPQTYGIYIPVFETKLRPVFELILSDPDADFEKELSKAAQLINSTVLNYKDKDITNEKLEAYYNALADFYKSNYPEYYNKYFTKLLEEHYKVW